MRIWDIDPGYLNRQSLLAEHLELNEIASLIIDNKKGGYRHPEAIRWLNYDWALQKRLQQLLAEMTLRGYADKSSVQLQTKQGHWPDTYIDSPFHQFEILQGEYKDKDQGRIPLPKTAQELWRHHKYSVLARDINSYKAIGKQVSTLRPRDDSSELATTLSKILRVAPTQGGIRNSVHHMWGYVSALPTVQQSKFEQWSLKELLEETQERTIKNNETYLLSSTALAELMVWIEDNA
jgi:hypothetical protein